MPPAWRSRALIFGLIFKTLPATKVTWRDVRVGRVVDRHPVHGRAAGARPLPGPQQRRLGLYRRGSLLALLVWVYYSSQLILFGAEFTVVYARRYLPSHDEVSRMRRRAPWHAAPPDRLIQA